MADLTEIFGPDGFDAQLFEAKYRFERDRNNEYLAELVSSDDKLTKGTREFIAGVLTGKIKQPKNSYSRSFDRNEKIYNFFLDQQNKNPSQSDEQISETAALVFNLSSYTLHDIYKAVKRAHDAE